MAGLTWEKGVGGRGARIGSYKARIVAGLAGLLLGLASTMPVLADPWVATAYDACVPCCGKADGITASGKKGRAGHTVAVNWLPFGTKVKINGKVYEVEDRGARSHFGSRDDHKKRVDIFMGSHAEAREFGRRVVEVEILGREA